MVAQEIGASEKHAVMAAGLAGSIGLSGGGCVEIIEVLVAKSSEE